MSRYDLLRLLEKRLSLWLSHIRRELVAETQRLADS